MLRMDVAAIDRFLTEHFPQAKAVGFEIAALTEDRLVLTLEPGDEHLRPGGTVSGPTLMTMADTATYLLILARLGPVALAVTTNLNIHFMRKPEPTTLHAEARLLKLGQRLAVAEVRLYGPDPACVYAHATVSYSIPPR
jgi:uncharacterized protein (TIGR00369 family)